ncbi:TPA: hypothetical protein DIV45_01385 [Patescibacteria group bacterium]|uniref:Alcohol dehydrogenase iron-type/glycerol dehydrogenase GldA domain-containing protein n=1 Tax=Candidatus Woykebacteria bacterium GWA1_44_8 TaxID=1802591 RepID=A0A1G1W4L0_9BACT|nr:MAG: hypothetical protein A2113_00435 [Candidatus Woykebacteria bacterium GWA1_44_8]HCR42001.1 hypothetical protein [Patescibacteria group bacterium]
MAITLTTDIKVIESQITETYQLPVKVYFGRGVFKQLPDFLTNKYKNILVVVGNHLKLDPEFKNVISNIQDRSRAVVYRGVINKSTPEQINPLLQLVRAANFDVIVGVGGGTILDSVKSVAYLAHTEGDIEDYLEGKSANQLGISWVGVPTNAGTGSEVTPWAVIWGEDGKKHSLHKPEMFADFVVVDPALTDNLPKNETALTGADAFTQAVEAYWNVNNNPTSDRYALEAIKILFNNLPNTINHSTPELRDQVMWGALLAGLAFSNTKTTICHTISYKLTSKFNVPHGQAVVVTLPLMLKKIIPVLEERSKPLLEALGSNNANEAVDVTKLFIQNIGLKTTLIELGISQDDLSVIVADLPVNRLSNSPVVPTTAELLVWLADLTVPTGSVSIVQTGLKLTDKDYQWSADLSRLRDILDVAGVKYWLDMGTLLGAIREGRFIGWDDDIDLSFPITDAPKVLALVDQFFALGYRVDVTDSSLYLSGLGKPKVGLAFYRERGDHVWISFLIKYPRFDRILRHVRRVANKIIYQPWQRGLPKLEQNFYTWSPVFLRQSIRQFGFWIETVLGERNYALVVPRRLVDNLTTIKFYGLNFNVPHPVEEYLALMYGEDWRIPNSNWHWEDTKAINYQFVPFTRRADYNLFNAQDTSAIEHQIIDRFNHVGTNWIEETASDDNFEWQIIKDWLGQPIGLEQKVLDVGSGKGKFTSKIQVQGFAVVGVEPASNLITAARTFHPNVEFVHAGATQLPFPDSTFSHLVCVEVLEHLPDTDRAIREFYRVLKPSGQLLIIDKNITSWHYLYLIPTVLWKWTKEITNQWMYPRKFPFREKYFTPQTLTILLRKYFPETTWQGLQFKPNVRVRSGFKQWYWVGNQKISGLLHRHFPARDFYLAWRATK